MLGFYPQLTINYNWNNLQLTVESVAKQFIHTARFKKNLMYEQGNSQVAHLPDGGWISKSATSYDFFVLGGISETKILEQKFQEAFPNFTFSPATICWTSQDVPLHKDHPKNGKCSLIYPLHSSNSCGVVYDPAGLENFTYGFLESQPIMINITVLHMVKIFEPRIWFSIHTHEPIEVVNEEFNKRGHIII